MKLKKTDVEYWRKEIKKYAKHEANRNFISMALSRINSQFGPEERNRAIRDYELDKYPFGFQIKKVEITTKTEE